MYLYLLDLLLVGVAIVTHDIDMPSRRAGK